MPPRRPPGPVRCRLRPRRSSTGGSAGTGPPDTSRRWPPAAASSRSVSSWVGVVGTASATASGAPSSGLPLPGAAAEPAGGSTPQQRADGDAEDPAHGDEIFQLRHGGVGLPLADRLPGRRPAVPPGPPGRVRQPCGPSGCGRPAYPVFPCASPPLPSVSQRAAEPATTGGFPLSTAGCVFSAYHTAGDLEKA